MGETPSRKGAVDRTRKVLWQDQCQQVEVGRARKSQGATVHSPLPALGQPSGMALSLAGSQVALH